MYHPLNQNILLKRVSIEEQVQNGIILPGSQDNRSPEGIVVGINEDNFLDLKIGDRVVFTKLAGVVRIKGEEHILVDEEDLVAVMTA